MAQYKSRKDFLENNPMASAYSALAEAEKQTERIAEGAMKLKEGQLEGKKVVIIGSGVGGLTTAYEILAQKSGAKVTVLEALNRTGGRCLSLRTGDTFTEDENSKLTGSKPRKKPQVVRFKRPVGDAEPYLNAGPGRIPSSHKRLLHYLKKFSVEVEVYVMNSESNLVQKDKSFGGKPKVYRQLNHNTRGWLAQMVYSKAKELLEHEDMEVKENLDDRVKDLQSLMISFGELDANGMYKVTAGADGFENGKTRAGYSELPGVSAGEVADVLSFDKLLKSKFWEGTKFYQPSDFLWQPTLFQPVGGMDQVQHAFVQQVAALGGDIHLNSPVKEIDWDSESEQFIISVAQVGTKERLVYKADYCICNLAMPFLKDIVSDKLMQGNMFEKRFKNALEAVYVAQFKPTEAPGYTPREDEYIPKFLAATTKVGWQANRDLWQGSPIQSKTLGVKESEIGVVPIFGGISWTDDEIQQIWYPSTAYQDEKGVLTGAYNFDKIASDWGELSVQERLDKAQEGAKKFNEEFAAGLKDGLAIAWQNMPHIKGGWAYWQAVGKAEYATEQFNAIAQGTRISDSEKGTKSDPCFFIVGDQISSLPGWQEGAIASAINVITRMAEPTLEIAYLKNLPDTRLMVEGI